ncbi:MAG TPA: ABC transporter ATP-binding protein, partial [Herpetosiphonaceae bacterium]|nr:ABC transporter ATP-binding protein [Herpetosiphonaceae bacterium]
TILKLIAGLEQPDRGEIELDGASIGRVPAHRRNTVLMFQDAYLFPFLSVADNIAFGLRARKLPRSRIRAEVGRMLELVELPDIGRRYPHQLSGGQQQRVALARALVVEPRVLMLDEPLSNLDPSIRGTLQTVIRRLQRDLKITMILVTHDLGEAISLSDRTVVLLGGRIAADATPSAVFTRPPNRAAAQFVGISTILEGVLAGHSFASPLGPLQVAGYADSARPALFAIRPEHMRLSDRLGLNTLPGIVEAQVYRGEFIEYGVRIGPLLIQLKAATARAYPPGSPVWVHFPIEQLFEIAGDSA